MNFLYRNDTGQTMRFELGGSRYVLPPNSNVEIPEKYNYVVELLGLRLTKLYNQSIELDKIRNPKEWIELSTQELIAKIDSEKQKELQQIEIQPKPKKKGRRKKE